MLMDRNNKKIILGTWGTSKKGWKGVNLEEAYKTLELAIELGITTFDTAPIYGFGESEKILGKLLKGRRNKYIISTKCGLEYNNRGKVYHDLSPKTIEKSVIESLNRLQTDYIDILFLHWPDHNTSINETVQILEKLKKRNIIREIGISNFSPSELEQAVKITPIKTVQYKYNFLENKDMCPIFDICKNNNIEFWAYSPFAQGLLTNQISSDYTFAQKDIRKLNPLFSNKNIFQKALKKREQLGSNFAEGALNFLCQENTVNGIILGTTQQTHLRDNISTINNYFNKQLKS